MFRSMPFILNGTEMLFCQCEKKISWDFRHAAKKLSLPVYPWKVYIRELSSGKENQLPTKSADNVVEKCPVGYFSEQGLLVSLVVGSVGDDGKPRFSLNRFMPDQQDKPDFYRPTNIGFSSKDFVCTGESLRLRDKPYDVFVRHKDTRRHCFIDSDLEFCSSVIPVANEPKVVLTGRIKGQTKSILIDFLNKKAFESFDSEGKAMTLFSIYGPLAAYCVPKGEGPEETDIELGPYRLEPCEIGLRIEGTF